VLAEARNQNVDTLITIGTEPGDWPLYQKLAAAEAGIHWTVGLHPGSVTEDWERDLSELSGYIGASPRPVALGEIGLDFFRLPQDAAAKADVQRWQEAAFRWQLAKAREADLPVVVHSRGAIADCLRVLEAEAFPMQRVVFHCFAEGAAEMADLAATGARGSFTGIVTFRKADEVREALRAQPIDRLMVETDAPYLAPVPHRGKECRPAMVAHTGEACAEILDTPVEEVAEITRRATRAFFGLPVD
jgi:TatD DNase family protein